MERDHRHRAAFVEFGLMRYRLELYEQLARRVENRRLPLGRRGVAALEAFLQEDPPARDYGSTRARNERIARLLTDLDGTDDGGLRSSGRGDAQASADRPPRSSDELHETLLSKKLALPIFASDPLSSVAYATEAALVVLVAASLRRRTWCCRFRSRFPSCSRSSFSPTARRCAPTRRAGAPTWSRATTSGHAQLRGGGRVAGRLRPHRGRLGHRRGPALTSAVPELEATRSRSRLASSRLLTVANLRGVRESGMLFALPTYAFVAVMYVMVATGVGKCAAGTARKRMCRTPFRPALVRSACSSFFCAPSLQVLPPLPVSKRSRTASAHSNRRAAKTPPRRSRRWD